MNMDTQLQELGDRLERSAAARLRSERRTLGTAVSWAGRRRSQLLASSTLGLAGAGAAVLIAVGGTAGTAPAFAITRSNDGSVLVQLNAQEDLGQANQKLAAMGINEQITLYSNPNPTGSTAPESCVAGPGVTTLNPPIELQVSTNDADNTGTTSAVRCVVVPG